MKLHTPQFYAITEPFVDLNFGKIELSEDNSVKVLIKDLNGDIVLSENLKSH